MTRLGENALHHATSELSWALGPRFDAVLKGAQEILIYSRIFQERAFPPHGYFYFAPNDFGQTMKPEMLQGEIGLHPLNR